MKINNFDMYTSINARQSQRARQTKGPGIGPALLGVACVVGVFGLLTLLYHFG